MIVAKVEQSQIDPLYVIFEQHLLNFGDSDLDRKTFVLNVLQDYFSYLRKRNISVPKSMEGPIIEELSEQVRILLIKKIYGCLTITDFQKKVSRTKKRQVSSQYSRLKTVA